MATCEICGKPWVLFAHGKYFCINCAFLLDMLSAGEEEVWFSTTEKGDDNSGKLVCE